MCNLPTMYQTDGFSLEEIEMLTETFWFIKNLSQTNKTILLRPLLPSIHPIICP